MTMILVNSTSIHSVGYQGDTLAVRFHTSDTIYTHPGVPRAVYIDFINADSMGAFYNRYIRGRYR